MMHYGMPTLIENSTLDENIALCKRLGLDFIEINMNFPEYQLDMLEKHVDEMYEKAKDAGIYYTIHLDETLNIADFNPLVREAYLETVRRTVEIMKKFQKLAVMCEQKHTAQPLTLNMHMVHGIVTTLPDRKVMMYERDFDVYFDYFAKFRDLFEEWTGWNEVKGATEFSEAADTGRFPMIRIAIENTDGFRSYEKKVIEHLLESPAFVLTWDIGHSAVENESDRPFILEHKDKLRHFHLHDADKRAGKNHLAFTDGELDIPYYLSLANECGARCVLETKTVAALEKSVNYIISKN